MIFFFNFWRIPAHPKSHSLSPEPQLGLSLGKLWDLTHKYSQTWPLALGRGEYLDCSPQWLFPFSVNQTQYIGSLCGAESAGVACVFAQTGTSFFHYLRPKEHKEHWSREEGNFVFLRDSTLWTLIWTKWSGAFTCWCWGGGGVIPLWNLPPLFPMTAT